MHSQLSKSGICYTLDMAKSGWLAAFLILLSWSLVPGQPGGGQSQWEGFPTGVSYPIVQIVRVIDGDTLEAWLQIAPRLAYFADLRLQGVDTPEIRGACKSEGLRVRDIVAGWMEEAAPLRFEPTEISFERWVGYVWLEDGRGEFELGARLLAFGLTTLELCR